MSFRTKLRARDTPMSSVPRVFTVGQMETALSWVRTESPRQLAWFVLTAMCGLRPEEAMLASWAAVKDDHVVVEAHTCKTSQRRLVYAPPSAMAWLRYAQATGSSLPLPSPAKRRMQRRLAEVLGFAEGWPQDITRHTAASYWVAQFSNANEVAENLGHSVKILRSHYKSVVTREAAAQFWALMPPQGAQVLPFPTPTLSEKQNRPASARGRPA